MSYEFGKVLSYSWKFYTSRLGRITAFSIPFIFALSIPVLVSAPTYTALGSIFIRTQSIPELELAGLIFTAAAYFISLFIISDSIVNINLVIKSRKTLTSIGKTIMMGIKEYAGRIFYIYTILLLLLFVAQLLSYDMPFRELFYPIFVLFLGFVTFFIAPAVVIDHSDTPTAIRRSFRLASEKPLYVVLWTLAGFFLISAIELISYLILPGMLGPAFVLLFNSLFILPFLIILQTTMYMEKYPLAR
jgi:hypothetical protein